jgi:aminoglycoside phosphotransferase (APT) family kinase protein
MDTSKARELIEGQLGPGDWAATRFGAGKFSEVFAAESRRGRYVLRVAPPDSVRQLFYEYRMMRQEPALHTRLLTETNVPVPEIAAFDFSRRTVDRDYLIMPRLAGVPLSQADLPPGPAARALREWGQYVAQIHSLTDPETRFGYLGEHNCMDPQPTWGEAFAVMYRKELADIVNCGIYTPAVAEKSMALLEANLEVFDACRTSHLLHGDLWVTNLLVKEDGEVTGVLDFDRACWGDIEWDLAIAEYCGVTRPPFWEGYARPVDTHTGDAAVRRMFYLLYEHQKYIVISMSPRRNDPPGAEQYAAKSQSVMEGFRRSGDPVF